MMQRDPKVKLFYPPYCWAGWDGPHLALPLLSTYLRSVGIDCSYVDLNVRFRKYLARPGGELARFVIGKLEEYLSYQGLDSLAPGQIRDLGRLLQAISTLPRSVVQRHITQGAWVEQPRAETGIGPVSSDLAVAQLGELTQELPGLWEDVLALVRNRTWSKQPILERFLDWDGVADEMVDASTADVVGINVSFSVQLGAALSIASLLKQRAEHVTVVLGGTQVTLLPQEDQDALAALPFVDGIVVFEGELALERLARTVAAGGCVDQVPNLVTALDDGSVLRTGTLPGLHPNDLPTPELNGADLALYGETPQFTLLAALGCYWGRCSYCDYARLRAPGQRRYDYRAPERVAEDAEFFIENYGARRFWLVADALPPKWTRNFGQAVIARGVRADFGSYMRTESRKVISSELVRLMKEAGFTDVVLGAESFSDRVLEAMKKGTSGDDVEQNLRLLGDAGIKVTLNMIPDFPTTTYEEAVADIRRIIDNVPWIGALNGRSFDLTDGTEVALHPEEYGIVLDRAAGRFSSCHGAHSLRFERSIGMRGAEHRRLLTAFRDLARHVPQCRASGRNRAKACHQDFNWDAARLRLCSFLSLPSRFSLSRGGAREDVMVLLIPTLRSYVEIPRYHHRVLELLLSAGQADVPFPEFRAAFAQDVASVDPEVTELDLHQMCRQLVLDFVDAGFVEHVSGGGVAAVPCAEPGPRLSAILERLIDDGSRAAPQL